MTAPHRPIHGEDLGVILARGEAVLSQYTGTSWRHFGLAKADAFDRRLVGDLERGERGTR